jgi:hypothetical protein
MWASLGQVREADSEPSAGDRAGVLGGALSVATRAGGTSSLSLSARAPPPT